MLQKDPHRCCKTSLIVSTYRTVSILYCSTTISGLLTLICWPICWLMTTLTRARDTAMPLSLVIKSSKVRFAISCWASGSHLGKRVEISLDE